MAAPDALVPHLLATLSIDWERPPDDVAALLRQVDALPSTDEEDAWDPRPEDLARQARLAAARTELRALAAARAPLDLDAIARVQELVLGGPAPLRATTAFARGVAYACFPGWERMLRRKVAVDAADACHPLAQACRLYLDLIHFHPFADGNARAARLWFELLLRRGRIAVPPLRDVVRLPKAGLDGWTFVRFAARRTLARAHALEAAG